MMCRLVAVLAVLATVKPLGVVATEEAASKMRPVTKVITLLKDMLKQLDEEKLKDKEIYENMVCWCKGNDKKKSTAIKNAETRITELKDAIEEYVAKIAQLVTEMEDLNTEVTKNREALDAATVLRQKQVAEFNAEEAELISTIESVTAAAAAIAEHSQTTFVQLSSSSFKTVAGKVEGLMQRHEGLLKGVLTPSQRRSMSSFLQLAARAAAKSKTKEFGDSSYHPEYAAQSGEIFGMLSQMKETFQDNLKKIQEEEKVNQITYTKLKAAKEEEISAGELQIQIRTEQKAINEEKLSQSRIELADLEVSLEADREFLDNLKKKCKQSDEEYEERLTTRDAEIDAVNEALTILSGDEAQDIFARTFNSASSFLQVSSTQATKRRTEASRLLARVAQRFHNPRLSTLAVKVRLDAFTKVKAAIDKMVAELQKQKADEIQKKASCINMINDNELATQAKERAKTDLESKIAVLEGEIADLKEGIGALRADIADLMLSLKTASENRDQESKDFQATLADQHATEKLLTAAVRILEEHYGNQTFMQLGSSYRQAPPEMYENKPMEKQDSGVIRLINEIIKDAQTMAKESKKAESDAAAAYETFAQETKTTVDVKLGEIANKADTMATKEDDLNEAKKDLDDTKTDIEDLQAAKRNLHGECDYTLLNFDIRQQARDEEVEALQQAKAILGGAQFTTFLETGH